MKFAVVPLRSLIGGVTRIQTKPAHQFCHILLHTINLCRNLFSYLPNNHSPSSSPSSSNNLLLRLLCIIQHFRLSRWPGFRNPTDLPLALLDPMECCPFPISSLSTRLWFLLLHIIPSARCLSLALKFSIIILLHQRTLLHTRATLTLTLTGKGKSRPQTSRTRTENHIFPVARMAE